MTPIALLLKNCVIRRERVSVTEPITPIAWDSPNVNRASGPYLMTSIRAFEASRRAMGVGSDSGSSMATSANLLPRWIGRGSSMARRFTGIIVTTSRGTSPRAMTYRRSAPARAAIITSLTVAPRAFATRLMSSRA